MKTMLSWSSGKDSAWALHILQQDPGTELVGLFTTINERANRVAMHAVRRELLQQQARAAGLPVDVVLLPHPCSNEVYERAMSEYILAASSRGVERIAFGDLFLEDVRRYRERQFADSNIELVFPIWGRNTAELSMQMIEAGVRAQITCIDPRRLPVEFARREYNEHFINDLPANVDPCGENGEFHSFAFAGPMFCTDISVTVGDTVERDEFIFTDLVPTRSTGVRHAQKQTRRADY